MLRIRNTNNHVFKVLWACSLWACSLWACTQWACSVGRAETIYSINLSAGLDANWTTASTHDNGRITVGPRGSHAHVLNMNIKGNSVPLSLVNKATLSLNVLPGRHYNLSFNHFATWDPTDPEDGVKISTNGTDWEWVWQSPISFTDGEMSVSGLDLTPTLASLTHTGMLLIRFQSRNSFVPGNLRSEGRGWNDITLASVPVPEPTTFGLFLTGVASAICTLQRRASRRRI
jgi:hypothetical protein